MVDQYTERFPCPTGPVTTVPGHPDDRQHSSPTAGNDSDSSLLDWLSAIGAPVPPGTGPDAPELELSQASDPQHLAGAQPAPQTETGSIGSGMGIVFPAILLLVTVAALASLFALKGEHGQAGQD